MSASSRINLLFRTRVGCLAGCLAGYSSLFFLLFSLPLLPVAASLSAVCASSFSSSHLHMTSCSCRSDSTTNWAWLLNDYWLTTTAYLASPRLLAPGLPDCWIDIFVFAQRLVNRKGWTASGRQSPSKNPVGASGSPDWRAYYSRRIDVGFFLFFFFLSLTRCNQGESQMATAAADFYRWRGKILPATNLLFFPTAASKFLSTLFSSARLCRWEN